MWRMIAMLLFIGLPGIARAEQPPCDTRDNLLEQLGRGFGESTAGLGLTSSGALIELLTSESGETWTMILTVPGGPSCMVATGESWQPRSVLATRAGAYINY